MWFNSPCVLWKLLKTGSTTGIVAVVPQADSRGNMRLVKDLRESKTHSRLVFDGLVAIVLKETALKENSMQKPEEKNIFSKSQILAEKLQGIP